jgi:hypothetical protein
MTSKFWTPEKKKDYLDLKRKREHRREYHRKYIKRARDEGKYKYFRKDGKVMFEKVI